VRISDLIFGQTHWLSCLSIDHSQMVVAHSISDVGPI
jgi:2C-methyl-D-erythritol 2,4-cyclodiphosphate synthase